MRKMMIWAAAIALTGFTGLLPFSGTDVGKLHPVEVVIASVKDGIICVETDTGVCGTGETTQKAIEDLKRLAAGKVFLETANYLLVREDSIYLLDTFYDLLRPACQVYVFAGNGEWEDVSNYLESHLSRMTLLRYRQGFRDIPRLFVQGEGYQIEGS